MKKIEFSRITIKNVNLEERILAKGNIKEILFEFQKKKKKLIGN